MLNYHKLSIPERILLVEEILDTIVQDTVASNGDFLEWQKSELKKRLHAYAQNASSTVPWRDAIKNIASKL